MKKPLKFLVGMLLFTVALSATACSEAQPMRSGASATAIALGHGNCVTEVTVVVDGYGNPLKVQFDDIFPASNVYNNTALGSDAPTVTCADNKTYYEYLHIGAKYFRVNENGTYSEIGSQSGTGISDLMTYYKTAEGTKWYYDSFLAGNLYVCAVSENGAQVADVKLVDKYKFNTANGSMRKRYSRYWSTLGDGKISQVSGLGFNGNMDMLENYLLANGFGALDDVDKAVMLPGSDGNAGNYNVIGGVSTGATLSSDTAIYLKVAKEAYEKVLEKQKDIA